MNSRNKTLLLADNQENYLRATRLALEKKLPGFEITTANSARETLSLLQQGWYHLAVIDKRLETDREDDLSGLRLLENAPHAVVKILNTQYQDPYDAFEVTADRYKANNVVDVAYKLDGVDALVAKIQAAFEKHIPMNWNLAFSNEDQDLLKQIGARLPPHGPEEWPDLLRMAFVNFSSVNILATEGGGPSLWQADGRVALKIVALRPHAPEISFLLVVGGVAVIEKELEDYKDYHQAALAYSTQLNRTVKTTHLGANCYLLVGVRDLAKLRPLTTVFNLPVTPTGMHHASFQAIEELLENTLPAWPHYLETTESSPAEWYCAQMELPPLSELLQGVEEPVSRLVRLLEERQIASIRFAGPPARSEMFVTLPGGGQDHFPDPLALLRPGKQSLLAMTTPFYLHYAPGRLTDHNLLTDMKGRVWLTNFLGAGLHPALWLPAQLEAALLFDWTETSEYNLSLVHRHALQREVLTCPAATSQPPQDTMKNGSTANALPDPPSTIPTGLVEYYEAIRLVRKWAQPVLYRSDVPCAVQNYWIVLFYQATSRVFRLFGNPSSQASIARLVAGGQALLAMGLLAGILAQLRGDDNRTLLPAQLPKRGLYFHGETHSFFVDGLPLRLTPGEDFNVLLFLYQQRPKVCSKEEILTALGKQRSGNIYQDGNMVEASISRLREKIKAECGRNLIETVRGRGYCIPETETPSNS